MTHEFSRTESLIGRDALEKLSNSKVSVYGIGGVGSYVAEGLARAGVGHLVLVDPDVVCPSNINRQIQATSKTIGQPKVEAMRERIINIHPNVVVEAIQQRYMPGMAQEMIRGDECYIVDAMDTVTAKIDLIVSATERAIPIISSMGAGNKLDPTQFEVADIYRTSVCPLARVMRRELRQRGVETLKVVYSKEEPLKPLEVENELELTLGNQAQGFSVNQRTPASISFVPSVAGLIIAGEVIKDIIEFDRRNRT